jgi:hypothetical protein
MMAYYIYDSASPLGHERCGTDGKSIWRDLKTDIGAINRARRLFAGKTFSLFAFRNIYDNTTFRLVYRRDTFKKA